jgi:hypothetical protein
MKKRTSKRNVLVAVAAVTAPAAIALWQFYAFVTFKTAGAIDLQGGRHHLWWAIGFGLIAFIGAFFFASFFLRYDRSDELHITSPPSRRETIL